MNLLSSVFGGIGLALVVSTMALGGCGGDKSAVGGGSGGAAGNTGGSGNVGGGATTGGASGGGATGCSPVKVPVSGMMTDFSEQAEGAIANVDNKDVKWGTSTSLTGGTFLYFPDGADADAPIGVIEAGTLHITATIAPNDYNGFGFYFGPNCGSDATAFAGISFDIGGTITGAAVDVQVQMTPNYPLNDNSKGTCDYEAAGAAKWDYCTNPHVSLAKLMADAPFPETLTTVQVPWAELVGGNPQDAIDATQLLGIQLQFNCGDVACPIDVKIDNLKFY
jgi:hypothetical protein